MSIQTQERIVCDLCSDDVTDRIHYEIKLRKFSTVNMEYLELRTAHICDKHDIDVLKVVMR